MESVIDAFQNTTPTGWIISILLTIVVFFLKRFIKSIDKMETSLEEIKDTIIAHTGKVDEHERRLNVIEEKLYDQ